jgi:hypothetical protein
MENKSDTEKRILFQGNSVAFAAHIRRPDDFEIPAVASSCLPVTGGLAEASSGPQRFRDVISFESASTRAYGDYADTRRAADFTHGNSEENQLPANTFVESNLKGLRFDFPLDAVGDAAPVIRTLTVDNLHVRLESTYDRRNPVSFRSLEVTIDGFAVDGHRLKVFTAAADISEHCDTYEKLLKAYEQDSDFRKKYSGCFYPTGNEKTGLGGLLGKHEIPHGDGIVLGTVVTGLQWETEAARDTVIAGNRLEIKGIGTIFFGEVVYEEQGRRVTLLRFQLDSCHGGDGSAVEVRAFFQHWPPAK